MRAAHPRNCRDSASTGFTFLEVVVAVMILLGMTAVAVPIFMNQKARADNAATEASVVSIARTILIAVGIGGVSGPSPVTGPATVAVADGMGTITVPGGYALTYDEAAGHYCVQGQQGDSETWQASSDSGAPLIVSPGTCAVDGLGVPAAVNEQPAAASEGMLAPSASSSPDETQAPVGSAEPSPTATPTATADPVALSFTGDTTALSAVGSYVDATNGTTITVTADSTDVRMTANWEWITVTRGATTDTIYKTRGLDAVGVLTRVSNSNVRIALPSTQAYTLVIKYNGKSTGTIYEVLTAT